MYLNTDYDVTHFEELHDLGYLPIEVKSLEDTNHFYITNPDSNIICFIPENLLF